MITLSEKSDISHLWTKPYQSLKVSIILPHVQSSIYSLSGWGLVPGNETLWKMGARVLPGDAHNAAQWLERWPHTVLAWVCMFSPGPCGFSPRAVHLNCQSHVRQCSGRRTFASCSLPICRSSEANKGSVVHKGKVRTRRLEKLSVTKQIRSVATCDIRLHMHMCDLCPELDTVFVSMCWPGDVLATCSMSAGRAPAPPPLQPSRGQAVIG